MQINKNKAAKKRIIGSFGAKAAVAGLLAAVLGFGIMTGAPGVEATTLCVSWEVRKNLKRCGLPVKSSVGSPSPCGTISKRFMTTG